MSTATDLAGAPGPAAGELVVEPDTIAAAVLACPSVADLSGGHAGEIATYLPGRRVTGVRIRPDDPLAHVVVHVIGRYGPTVAEIATEVVAAVHAVAGPVPVRVGVDDLALPARSGPPASVRRVR
jgi:hypothetical protein